MKFIRIGVDLAKNYFQIHAPSSEAAPAVKRKLTRRTMREFFSNIEPCRVGMEACGSAHYWARELKAMGHDVSLMPPAYTKPYVKRVRTMPSMRRPSVKRSRDLPCVLCRSRALISKRH